MMLLQQKDEREAGLIKTLTHNRDTMKKALIYCRVSTEEQAGDERHSLKTQLHLCEKAIEDGGEFKLAKDGVYRDPGRSATNMNRPGLQDMLERIQSDKTIGAVFVQDTDRIARNANDHLTIKALLLKHDVKLISVSQPGLEDTPEGNFMDLVIAGVNQLQSQITSRKTVKSLTQKFEEGWWPTRAPFGYLNIGDPKDETSRVIGIDPIRAPLIAEIFKLYATGNYSLLEVRDMVHKQGLRTQAGKRVALSKMNEIIDGGHFYWGLMRWRGMEKIGNHKPIIDKETADRCLAIKKTNNRYACRRRKHNFILRGFVFCAICDQRYTAEHHFKKDKSYYHCNRSGDRIKCKDKYVQTEVLEKQVAAKFDELQFSEAMLDKVIDRVKTIYDAKRSSVATRKKKLMSTKLNFEHKLEVAEEKLIEGVIANDRYKALKIRYREQIDDVEDEIQKLDRSKNLKMDVIQEILAMMRDIGGTYRKASPELKRLYLGLFWQEFKASEGTLKEATKAPIVTALEAVGAVTQKPAQLERAFADLPTPSPAEEVQIRTVRGAYPDSNWR